MPELRQQPGESSANTIHAPAGGQQALPLRPLRWQVRSATVWIVSASVSMSISSVFEILPGSALAAGAGISFLVNLLVLATLPRHHHLSLDSTFGPQKNHEQPTPRIGGLGVMAGLLIGCALAYPACFSLLGPLLMAGLPAFGLGLLEDLTKRVSVRARLLATLSCGVLGYLITGYSITDVQVPGIDWLLSFSLVSVVFTAFAVGGVANALNIIDGMNGLASGVVMVVLGGFAVLCNSLGDIDLMLTCCILGASVFGFFLINWPFGKIFLGDGGACFLGFAVAWLAVLLLARHEEVSAWAPLLCCAFPVLEVGFSMLRRLRRSQKVGEPDCLHLHSLVHRRLARRLLPQASELARNSITGVLISFAGVLPVWVAVHWATDTPILIIGLAMCALIYAVSYARLTQFRWCFGALTLRRPVDLST